MNIGIYSCDFNWAGGIDFLHGVVKGLLTQKKIEVKIFLLVHDEGVAKKLTLRERGKSLVRNSLNLLTNFDSRKSTENKKLSIEAKNGNYSHINNIREIFDKEPVHIVYFNNNDNLSSKLSLFTSIKIDVILPVLSNSFPASFKIPWIGYLFDFVYRYHSHLYKKEFCLNTDISFATTLLNATSVIVNSKNTYSDVFKFFPYSKAKIFSLPFAPYTNELVFKEAVENIGILKKFSIKNPFFIISNQFWLHKSHETAFEALALLIQNEDYKAVELLCTGRMTDLSGTDNRKTELLGKIRELGLEGKVHFVGHISKVDQLSLMLRSIAVIQPTLFEGGPGGGSVYMAVAHGVEAIVSNIPVNKEIGNNPYVTYFEVSNSQDLALKMSTCRLANNRVKSYEIVEKENKKNLEDLGDCLISCINYTVEHHLKN